MGIVNHRYTLESTVQTGAGSLAASSSVRGNREQEPLPGGLQSSDTMTLVNRDLSGGSSPDVLQNGKKSTGGAKSMLGAVERSFEGTSPDKSCGMDNEMLD